MFYGLKRLFGHLAVEQVDFGAEHFRALAPGDELDALGAGVRALVELAGQVLHGKYGVRLRHGVHDVVDLRLGEHDGQALFEQGLVYALDVVAVQEPQACEPGDAGQGVEFCEGALCLLVVRGALFNVYSVDHINPP